MCGTFCVWVLRVIFSCWFLLLAVLFFSIATYVQMASAAATLLYKHSSPTINSRVWSSSMRMLLFVGQRRKLNYIKCAMSYSLSSSSSSSIHIFYQVLSCLFSRCI